MAVEGNGCDSRYLSAWLYHGPCWRRDCAIDMYSVLCELETAVAYVRVHGLGNRRACKPEASFCTAPLR